MSKWIPTKTSLSNKKYDWINLIVGIHNLQCGCDDPLKHTVEEIHNQEPDLKPNIPKWHTTGKDHGDPDDDVFGEDDLEKLFAEDTGENDAGATTSG